MAGAMPGSNPAPNAYPPMDQPGGAGNWAQRANSPEPPAWGGYPTSDKTSLGVAAGMEAGANKKQPGNGQTTETKKKGFFDSIRDFFYH